jgi:hypothetical protein
VTAHASFSAAVAAADPRFEYVLQPQAIERPWLYQQRKCHFRLYLLAHSPAARPSSVEKESGRRPHRGVPDPEPEVPKPGPASGCPPTMCWYMNERAYLAAAEQRWAVGSPDPAVQISRSRTVELRGLPAEDHALLWPVLLRSAKDLVGTLCRGALKAEALTLRQQQLSSFELLGVDVLLSHDLQRAAVLEINSGPWQDESESCMQLNMMKIVLGHMLPPSFAAHWPCDQSDQWLALT